jgi:hypothetical protein
MKNRKNHHNKLMQTLALMNDSDVIDLVLHAQRVHKGIGGESFLATVDGSKVFIKNIPLTALEEHDAHLRSTANLFDLPLFYQYGVDSSGFGVWRELAAIEQTTQWVLDNLCPNFPLLHHWRILPNKALSFATLLSEAEIEKNVKYWNNSDPVRHRLQAISGASSCIVLVCEYFSQTLEGWLNKEILAGEKRAKAALDHVDSSLACVNDVMTKKGMVHFDAHFRNIVTDDGELFISDFGLALSSEFSLTNEEKSFLERHKNYDRAMAAVSILHCALTTIFDRESWAHRLKDFVNGDEKILPSFIHPMANKFGKIALVMDQFFFELQHVSKSTPFPDEKIADLLLP